MDQIDYKALSEIASVLLTPGGMALGVWLLFRYLKGMKKEFKADLTKQTLELDSKINAIKTEMHDNGFVKKEMLTVLKDEAEKVHGAMDHRIDLLEHDIRSFQQMLMKGDK